MYAYCWARHNIWTYLAKYTCILIHYIIMCTALAKSWFICGSWMCCTCDTNAWPLSNNWFYMWNKHVTIAWQASDFTPGSYQRMITGKPKMLYYIIKVIRNLTYDSQCLTCGKPVIVFSSKWNNLPKQCSPLTKQTKLCLIHS